MLQSSTTWYGSQPWEKNEEVTSIDWGTGGRAQDSIDGGASNSAYQSDPSLEPPPSYEQSTDPAASAAGSAAVNTAPAAFNATPQQQPQVCF